MANRIAGIDVHKKVLTVVVVDRATPDEKPQRRRFLTMPTELRHLSIWLREFGGCRAAGAAVHGRGNNYELCA